MYIKVAEMKQAARQVSEIYKVSIDDASKMIGYYNNHDRRVIQDILDGLIFNKDWEIAADSVGVKITLPEPPEKVSGEIISPLTDNDIIPAEIINGIADTIETFCNEHNIPDMEKCRAGKWSVCCNYIGLKYIRPSGILRKGIKGNKYNMDIMEAFVQVYGDFCRYYCKPILQLDFCAFIGVDRFLLSDYLAGVRSDELTTKYFYVNKKLIEQKDMDFEWRLVEGRQNPTGVIFAAKNKAGWTDEKQVTQISVAAAPGAVALPRFGSVGIESK